MISEPDGATSLQAAQRPQGSYAPEGQPSTGWHLDLPVDHPSYPDPSNIWPPVGQPPAAMTASVVPAPAARSSAVPTAAVQTAAVQAAAIPLAGAAPATGPGQRGAMPADPSSWAGEQSVLERFESLRQLTGTVAHDINNLLSVIRNYADFVADALDEGREHGIDVAGPAGVGGAASPRVDARGVPGGWDAVRRDVAQIQRAGERAAELAAELLAAVRRQPVPVGPIDVNTLVRETVAMLRRPLGEHLDLRIELDDALWRVRADPARLEQAIVNLAMNARDAMPRGGTLTVTTGNVVLSDQNDAAAAVAPAGFGAGAPVWYPDRHRHPAGRRHVGVWVSDTGDGMTPATRARAFEPFFTTKPADRGTGLGLAVVREVVTEAGGEVQVCSTVGVGTTVSLLLPAVDQPAPDPAAGPEPTGADGLWIHPHRPDGHRPDASTRPSAVRRPYGQPPTAIPRATRSS